MSPSDVHAVAFEGPCLLASGPLAEVARAAWQAQRRELAGPLLVFDARSSQPLDLDLRGSEDEVLARLQPPPAKPGRPRLGVVAREVTLLPRHWKWLASQRGGASATLRRLVEQASRGSDARSRRRQAGESVDRFMLAMCGDLPGYEEASRAFWRGERETFAGLTHAWPADVRDHLNALATAAWSEDDADA